MTDPLAAGSTGSSATAGATMVGVGGGTTAMAPGAGAVSRSASGGLGAWALAAGVIGLDATAGLAGLAGVVPNGGASPLRGLVAGQGLTVHSHQDDTTGGVIDYAHLVVSTTPPPAPTSPSDAFWLNPSEVA